MEKLILRIHIVEERQLNREYIGRTVKSPAFYVEKKKYLLYNVLDITKWKSVQNTNI